MLSSSLLAKYMYQGNKNTLGHELGSHYVIHKPYIDMIILYDRQAKSFIYRIKGGRSIRGNIIPREEFKQILATRKTALWKSVYEGS